MMLSHVGAFLDFAQRATPCARRDAEVDTTITDVVYMDVGLCFEGVRQDRTLGDKALCTSTQPLGRIVMGDPAATGLLHAAQGSGGVCGEKGD